MIPTNISKRLGSWSVRKLYTSNFRADGAVEETYVVVFKFMTFHESSNDLSNWTL